MYVPDEDADAQLATDDEVKAAVSGGTVMAWLPGHGTGVLVNMCMLFGWMGIVLAVYLMVPGIRANMGWFALAIGCVSAATSFPWFMLMRGHGSARSWMHKCAVGLLAIGALALFLALIRGEWIAATLAGAGLLFSVLGARLIAGRSYALLAAYFRAKRAYEEGKGSRSGAA